MSFATPTELAAELHQDLDTSSAQQALDFATAQIIRATSQLFAVGTSTVELEGNEQRITLPQRPVTAVTTVLVAWPTGFWRTWTQDRDYYVSGSQLISIWMLFPDRVKITFTYGYATVPVDVKACCVALAGEKYVNPEGMTSEAIDDYVYKKYDPTNGTPGMALLRDLVDSYGSTAYVSSGS